MGQLVDGQWRAENILFNHDDKGLYFKRDAGRSDSGPLAAARSQPFRAVLTARHAGVHAA